MLKFIIFFFYIWVYTCTLYSQELQQNIFNQSRGSNKIGLSLISNSMTNQISTNSIEILNIKKAWLKYGNLTNNEEVIVSVFPAQTDNNEEIIQNLRPFINNEAYVSADSGVLIFADKEYNVKRLIEIVKQLNYLNIENQEIRVLQPKNIDSAEFSSIINDLFIEDRVISAGISRGNFLILKGRTNELNNVNYVLSKISVFDSVFETRIVKLKNSNLLDISDGISRMYENLAVVVPDSRTYSLIINAEKKIMKEITNLIDLAEKNKAKTQEVNIIELQNMDILRIEMMLKILLENRL